MANEGRKALVLNRFPFQGEKRGLTINSECSMLNIRQGWSRLCRMRKCKQQGLSDCALVMHNAQSEGSCPQDGKKENFKKKKAYDWGLEVHNEIIAWLKVKGAHNLCMMWGQGRPQKLTKCEINGTKRRGRECIKSLEHELTNIHKHT